MSTPRVCVLRAPGTNCDVETAFAFQRCGAAATRLHLFALLEKPSLLRDFQILCIPGGFSYGDDIGAGVIFSRQLRGRLGEALAEFLRSDTLVLGICNGYQVLLKAGILPGGAKGFSSSREEAPPATLSWNDNGKYTARWVRLGVASEKSVFLRGIREIELPIAHAEGRFVVRNESDIQTWQENGQVALHYLPRRSKGGGESSPSSNVLPFPDNPNGSAGNVAGLGDPSGRVLGLMPHPERFIDATQHPTWTRNRLEGEGAGLRLFRNAVEYFS